jgi:hypothetical protein
MKKKLLFFTALCFAALSVSASPEPGGPVTTISNVAICPGSSTVEVPVLVSYFTGVGSISLKFAYAPADIQNPEVTFINPVLEAWHTFTINTSIPGTIIISAYDPNVEEPITGMTLLDNDMLFVLAFDVVAINDLTTLTFVENSQGTSCEYGGVGPDYDPFPDTPGNEYYFPGDVDVMDFTAGETGAEQVICENNDAAEFSSITDASGEGSISVQWQSSTTSADAGFIDIEGATFQTFDPGSLAVDTWYRRVVKAELYTNSCYKYSNVIKITVNQRKTISGIFNYYNHAGNVLMTGENISVELYKSSDALHSTRLNLVTTDENGYYEFTGLCPDCEYDIVATSEASTYGAVNTTDAAQVNYWGAHSSPIEKVRFYAGDVGTTGEDQNLSVNSTDAGRIQQNFVFGTSFDRPWTFWLAGTSIANNPALESYPSVNLPVASNITANMYGLCTGDFNRSFNLSPVKSASTTLGLVYNGNRLVGNNEEFELPIHLVNASGVGAVSLVLNFPSDLVAVKDVVMKGAGGQLDWTVQGNELRIGWNSSNPCYLADNAELLTLNLKTTSAFTIGKSIGISLDSNPLNEIADETYDVIGNAVLSIETVNGSTLGLSEQSPLTGISMSNYPNPFKNSTLIDCTLPFSGMVTVEISNIMGKRVLVIPGNMQPAGNYQITVNTIDLPSGMYIATLRLKSTDNELIRSIKLTKNY